MNSGCARLPAPDRQDDPEPPALLGVDNDNGTSVVRPGDVPYAGGRPRTVPSGPVRPKDLGIVTCASACRPATHSWMSRRASCSALSARIASSTASRSVRSTSRLASSAATALAGPQDDASP